MLVCGVVFFVLSSILPASWPSGSAKSIGSPKGITPDGRCMREPLPDLRLVEYRPGAADILKPEALPSQKSPARRQCRERTPAFAWGLSHKKPVARVC